MMKATFENEATLDRISTREELCEVMELLCEAARNVETSRSGANAFFGDDENPPVFQDDVSALTDLLLGQADRPN